MFRRILFALLLCGLASCSATTGDCPREGGIGGTGGCAPIEPLT